jgi:uncharacterized protein (TIGR02598 family)
MREKVERISTSFFAVGRQNAFSLIEIVIAIAVASFCLVTILSLLPVGLHTAQVSRNQTRAAYVAEEIVGDLRSAPFTQAKILYEKSDGTLGTLASFTMTTPSTNYLACDGADNIVATVTAAQYSSGVGSAGTNFLAQVTVAPSILTTNLATVSVEVSTPAQSALSSRSRFGFQTMIGNRQ